MSRGYNNASTKDTMAETLAGVNSKKINEWKRFLEIAEVQKATRNGDKGEQIYLDTNVKKTLEKLKLSGMKYPVRYLLNAAVRVFLEANADKIDEQLSKL